MIENRHDRLPPAPNLAARHCWPTPFAHAPVGCTFTATDMSPVKLSAALSTVVMPGAVAPSSSTYASPSVPAEMTVSSDQHCNVSSHVR